MAHLKKIDYGKSRVRVAKLTRLADRHDFSDLTVHLHLQGAFEQSYLAGDNSLVIPTDTMKNTVYALAGGNPIDPIEGFGRLLGQHFLDTHAHVTEARIEVLQHRWDRLDPYAYEQGQERRLAQVWVSRGGATTEAGIENLVVLKTTKSAFEGYLRDRFTTLPETADRIFATSVSASWRYAKVDVEYNAAFSAARRALVDVFTSHFSKAVQETLFAMGNAVLQAVPAVEEVRLSLPNKHYLPVNLQPFGLENRNEVFLPVDEPHGLIEATIVR